MQEVRTVFIIDQDETTRRLVREIADSLGAINRTYSTAEEFFADYRGQPGCVVSEFRLLGMNGVELQVKLAKISAAMPVVFLTAHAETPMTVQAMRNGATTVLEKPCSNQELWDAVRKALVRDDKLRRIDAEHSELRHRFSRLTRKEREVLDLIAAGKPNKAIAKRLNVSLRTVESRRRQIFEKTCTESVAQLVRLLFQVESDEP